MGTTKDGETTVNIQFRVSTRDKLLEIGKKKETYDDVVLRLIDTYERVEGKE